MSEAPGMQESTTRFIQIPFNYSIFPAKAVSSVERDAYAVLTDLKPTITREVRGAPW